MTNQSKWLISAYAIFYCGGVLVPLDYKLTADEQLKLLGALEGGSSGRRISSLARDRSGAQTSGTSPRASSSSRRLRRKPILHGAKRWEEFRDAREPVFVPRTRADAACIVYSSGTGGRPKGCVLTHENYLEQCVALTSLYPFWPGVRYLSILPTNHAIDFMVGFIGPFVCGATVVHLRTLRPEYIRDAFTRYKITYMTLVPHGPEEPGTEPAPALRRSPSRAAQDPQRSHRCEPRADPWSPAPAHQPRAAGAGSRSVWRRVARAFRWRRFHRARNAPVLLRPRHSSRQRLWLHGSWNGDHRERSQAVSRGHRGQAAAGR